MLQIPLNRNDLTDEIWEPDDDRSHSLNIVYKRKSLSVLMIRMGDLEYFDGDASLAVSSIQTNFNTKKKLHLKSIKLDF